MYVPIPLLVVLVALALVGAFVIFFYWVFDKVDGDGRSRDPDPRSKFP